MRIRFDCGESQVANAEMDWVPPYGTMLSFAGGEDGPANYRAGHAFVPFNPCGPGADDGAGGRPYFQTGFVIVPVTRV